VVQPRVFKRAVDVPGVLVVIAALVGGALLILRDVAQPKLDAS